MKKSFMVTFVLVLMMVVFASSVSAQGTLSIGMRGSAVTTLQNNLKSLNYQIGVVDGIFGQQTKQAVMAYQSNNGLTVDGIVGSKTFEALQKSINVKMVISTANTFLGTPYIFGGTTPTGFDCFGFTQYVMVYNGIKIPRTAATQYLIGTPISRNNLKRGDLVFFETYQPGASHVGIYIGNNSFIHASSSLGVTVSSLSNSYWNIRYIGAKRVI